MTSSATVEFLILMLLAASVVAVVAARLRIPYTVALVVTGLTLGTVHLPVLNEFFSLRPDWLTPDVSLIVFLPALLFEGSLKIPIRQLRESSAPILLLATVGVLITALLTGLVLHWALGISTLVALVFGSIVAATDPISVLSIFRDVAVNKRLSVIMEGESLFNDGTSVVIYGILLAAVTSSHLAVWTGVREFFVEVLGGASVGLGLGYLFSKLTQRIDDPQIEITLTTVIAYGAYLFAQSLHLSGVIATVTAGLIVGNFGIPVGMSSRTQISLWSFWEYASFFINSILFLLIGLQVRVGDLVRSAPAMLLTIAVVLAGRMLSVYGLVPLSNLFSARVSLAWQHMLVLGGLRGALSLALALSLGPRFPNHDLVLNMTFAVVAFTIIVQGVAIKPMIRLLGLGTSEDDEYSLGRVRQIAVTAAISELDAMFGKHLLSTPVYQRMHQGLSSRLDAAKAIVEASYAGDREHVAEEMRTAKVGLLAAESTSIERALHEGMISSSGAKEMIRQAENHYNQLTMEEKP